MNAHSQRLSRVGFYVFEEVVSTSSAQRTSVVRDGRMGSGLLGRDMIRSKENPREDKPYGDTSRGRGANFVCTDAVNLHEVSNLSLSFVQR